MDQGSSIAPFGFTGELQDQGLVNLRARWYDPSAGVFTAVDPFSGFPETPYSLHPYQYAYSAPMTWTDPSGELAVFIDGGFSDAFGDGSLSSNAAIHELADKSTTLGLVDDVIKTGANSFSPVLAVIEERYPLHDVCYVKPLVLVRYSRSGVTVQDVAVYQQYLN